MWQEIAIIIIGLLTALYVGKKIYNMFGKGRHSSAACRGCCGCSKGRH